LGTVKALEQTKAWARRCAAGLYALVPGYLERLRGKAIILTYHRVLSQKELSTGGVQPGMYVTTETFAMHMRFLKENFSVIALGELLRLWSEGKWDAGRRYCVVTFDDGWLDNYLNALPVLKRLGLPATVFLATEFVGTNRWYWPDHIGWLCSHGRPGDTEQRRRTSEALERKFAWLAGSGLPLDHRGRDALIERCKTQAQHKIDALLSAWAQQLDVMLPRNRQVIDWSEAREMSAAGVSFGSHSATHRILTHLAADEARQEIEGSWATLRTKPITTVPVFCYPNGDWSAEVADLVQAAGYAAAVTTQFGYEDPALPRRFALRRIHVHDHVTHTPALFAFHLAGFNHAH
jgi:peptidoglycan/xylan/chitin deacetylase (PgdA/CDA1 family)